MRVLNTKELIFVLDQMAKGARRDLLASSVKESRMIVKDEDMEAAFEQISALLKQCQRMGGVGPATIVLKNSKEIFQPTIYGP